ncbi:hypothetical protein HYH03_005321 [Edaphochlamys debaryana]|uniref:F5/8 type C domain-containing protein n=1 Tax=Edaphochlamys debaryana TaxID=47281 RepID=A0A836C130_9CHLO|nr:hypothetical protein HYH03_005321 [Edaphochlamys debaryana]|eukprot:KAG2496496.1 hypothetical protein HYH03_005321 [Edaphochlamys debaryana]
MDPIASLTTGSIDDAVDGDKTSYFTAWAPTSRTGGQAFYWEVTFTQPANISYVELWGDFASYYAPLRVTLDDWYDIDLTVDEANSWTPTQQRRTAALAKPVAAASLRVYAQDRDLWGRPNADAFQLTLAEVIVYRAQKKAKRPPPPKSSPAPKRPPPKPSPPLETRANLALNRRVTMDSLANIDHGNINKAVDGDQTSYFSAWMSTSMAGGSAFYWEVTLDKPTNVSYVELWGDFASYYAPLRVTLDDWYDIDLTVDEANSWTPTQQRRTAALAKPVAAASLRVYAQDRGLWGRPNADAFQLTLAEVIVYGPRPPLPPAPSPPPAGVNLATNRRTYMEDIATIQFGSPDDAVDGDQTSYFTAWASTLKSGGKAFYWEVTFDKPTNVSYVELWGDFASYYAPLRVTLDDWYDIDLTVDEANSWTPTQQRRTAALAKPVAAASLRVYAQNRDLWGRPNADAFQLTLAEVIVYGPRGTDTPVPSPPPARVNLARNRPAVMDVPSKIWFTGAPGDAVDGDRGTAVSAMQPSRVSPHFFWQVDFAAASLVAHVEVWGDFANATAPLRVTLGDSYEVPLVVDTTASRRTMQRRFAELAPPVEASFLRVHSQNKDWWGRSRSDAYQLTLAEVIVYGP